MTEPVVKPRTYIFAWIGLLCLTLITTLIGFLDLGPFSMVFAILFAAAKASLIVLFFMHALYEFKLIHAIIGAGVVWLCIMIGLTLTDYISRGWIR